MKRIGMLVTPGERPSSDVWTKDGDDFVVTYSEWVDKVENVLQSKILKADIDRISSAKSNSYTLWAAVKNAGNTGVSWENLYARTEADRVGPSVLFRRRGERALALLLVPPTGIEPSLIFEAEKEEYFAGIDVTASYAQEDDAIGKYIASQQPTFTLAATEQADGLILITATASTDITGAELWWDITAGQIDRWRSVFTGTTASTLFKKPINAEPCKVKCGFKFYSGLAEIHF